MRTSLRALLAVAILCAGCGPESRFPVAGPGPVNPDTPPVVPPPVVPPPPPGPAACGTLSSGTLRVARSSPVAHLFTQTFDSAVTGRMFVVINPYASDTNIRFVAVSEALQRTVDFAIAGNSCGVLRDTTAVDSAIVRSAGVVSLPAGTWAFYADHASIVDCWESGAGSVNVIDARFEYCETP